VNSAAEEIVTTKPFRSVPRLVELVRYVVATSPDNESDWLEWKCGLDMTKAAGRFAIAKQIIGFANRDPRRAATHAGGCAFMVLGAEPQNMPGQPGMDPANLDAAIRPYVGADGPGWLPHTVNVSGTDVVVITVEPPRWGDPIHSLHKEYWAEDGTGGAKNGEVFIRRPGGTHPASSAELQMLQRRLVNRPAEGPEVVVQSVGEPIPRVDLSDDAVGVWLAEERKRLLAPMEMAERERIAKERPVAVKRSLSAQERRLYGATLPALEELRRSAKGMASLQASFRDVLGPSQLAEDRTPDTYRAEVERYLSAARKRVRSAALNGFRRVVNLRLALRAVNTDDRNLESVEVVVSFGGPVFTYERRNVTLPNAPRAWGPRKNPDFPFGVGVPRALVDIPRVTVPDWSPGYTAKNTGSTTIEFEPFDLRPHKEYELADVPLVVSAELAGSITGSWTATATNRDSRAEGSITVPLADTVVSIGDLLHAE
jgi:hypothetical protein